VRRLLLFVGATIFLDTMFFAALTPLLPDYADRFELSKVGAGVLSGAYPAGALVGGVPSGFATARLGARRVTIAGLLLLVGTTLAFGLGDSIVVLDVARFVQGIASAAAWTAGLAWLVASGPADRRGELIGSALAVAIVGALFGPVLGGAASITGTAPAFGTVALAALALAGWAVRMPPPPARSERQPLRALAEALGDPTIAAGMWFIVLPALLFGTLSVLAPLRLAELGFGALAIGATYLTSAALEAAASPLLGRVSDRRGRLLPIGVGLAASAVVALLLPWPAHAALLAPLVVAGGLAFGTFWAPATSLLADAAERRGLDYGYAFALTNLAWAPGQSLGASGGGALAEATSDTVPYLVLAATCVLTLGLLWRSASSS
jgi:MFS family permease